MKKTARQKIIAYLNRCKTPRTAPQISIGAHVNPNTARRILGDSITFGVNGQDDPECIGLPRPYQYYVI